MPLETTTFINGLDANNPAAGDTVGQADDHIRLIKASVKATFPNITGAVTVSQADLNATQNLQAVLNGKAASVHTHAISDVTGLQAALDGKAPTSHTHTSSQITDSTATGRSVLTAVSPSAARGVLEAAATGAVGSSGVTMSTGRLLGRTSASTGAVEEISVGSGLSLSGGTLSVPAVPSVQLRSQLFTTSDTWVVPPGVTQVQVTVIGGGGGGGGSNNNQRAQNGGVGGFAVGSYSVTPGSSITVTVGAGGAGTNNTSATGGAGGTSSFGSFISATGGGGGALTTMGSNGTGSSGTVRNGTMFSTFHLFPGTDTRPNGASATAPLTWAASLVHHPGACGSGENVDVVGVNDASGGVGGVVYLEWVG